MRNIFKTLLMLSICALFGLAACTSAEEPTPQKTEPANTTGTDDNQGLDNEDYYTSDAGTSSTNTNTGSDAGSTNNNNNNNNNTNTNPTSNGAVGDACLQDTDCTGTSPFCLTEADYEFPGGYCTDDCTATGECAAGSTCYSVTEDGSVAICIKDCTGAADCRVSEGYACDEYNTCWVSSEGGSTPSGSGAVGDACLQDTECTGTSPFCLTEADYEFPGGYCTDDCTATGECAAGSTCYSVTEDGSVAICIKDCTGAADCRVSEGYACDEYNTCWVSSGGSTPTTECETDYDCDYGYVCTNSECVEEGGTTPTGECETDYDCDMEFICESTECVAGCRSDWDCLDDRICGQDGFCTDPAPEVGDACILDTDCPVDDGYELCLVESYGFPGGYCTITLCDDTDYPCPDGSSCYWIGDPETDEDAFTMCIKDCSSDYDCRDGYVCDVDDTCWLE